MRYMVDEDVDVAVGGLLANRSHDVRYVVQDLGAGSKDPTIRRYLRALLRSGDVILVTADNEFAGRAAQAGSRLPCLWLRDLHDQEFIRARDLVDVIESESKVMGATFFMEIRVRSYIVRR